VFTRATCEKAGEALEQLARLVPAALQAQGVGEPEAAGEEQASF
jgi:hypothetical protein